MPKFRGKKIIHLICIKVLALTCCGFDFLKMIKCTKLEMKNRINRLPHFSSFRITCGNTAGSNNNNRYALISEETKIFLCLTRENNITTYTK